MGISEIHVPLDRWTAEDVKAAVKAAPPALCADSAQADTLLDLKPCDTFAELLYQLYPTHTGNLAGAGRLAERVAKASNVKTESGTVDLDQSEYPPRGHIGVVGDLTVEGDLTVVAALVVTGDHGFEANGGLALRHKPANGAEWGPDIFDIRNSDHVEELRKLLGPDAIDDEDELVWDAIPSRSDAWG